MKMGVKRTQKTQLESHEKKAKKSTLCDENAKEFQEGKLRKRTTRKNYYESGNSFLDDSDADADFDPAIFKKKQKRKGVSETDSESSSDDEKVSKVKRKKAPKKIPAKRQAANSKRKKLKKKESSDSDSNSNENDEKPLTKSYQPLLSSEGSDSDVPIAPKITTKKDKNVMLESTQSEKMVKTQGHVKLVNKNIKKEIAETEEPKVKTDFDCKPSLWKEENLDSSEDEIEEKKLEIQLKPSEKLTERKKKKESKLTSTKNKKTKSKAEQHEEEEEEKEKEEDSSEDEMEEKKLEIQLKPSEKLTERKKKKDSKKTSTKNKKAKSKAEQHEEEENEEEESSCLKKTSKSKSPKKKNKITVPKTEKKISSMKDSNDVSAVLMHFEGSKKGHKLLSDSEESVDAPNESSESDWEEVADDPSVPGTSSDKPQQAIEITLEQKQFVKKKKNVGNFDWKAFFRRKMNVFRRELRISIHKVHLLCLIGHGMVLNRLCSSPVLKALSFSIIPWIDKENFTVAKIKKLLIAFSAQVKLTSHEMETEAPSYPSIIKAFSNCEATSSKEYTMMVVMCLRSLGLKVRFVMSFHPYPLQETKGEKKKSLDAKSKSVGKTSENTKDKKSANKEIKEKKKKTIVTKKPTPKVSAKKARDETDENSEVKERSRPSRKKSANISYRESDGSDLDEEEDGISEKKPKRNSKKTLASKVAEKMSSSSSFDSSDDFEKDSIKDPTPKRTKFKPGHKIISSSSSNSSSINNSINISVTETWIEVYLEKEKRWLSVDCVNMVFDEISHFEESNCQPLSYILTFDNDGFLKDVTPRYSSQWMLKTRKLRVQEEWWDETMKPYLKKDEDNEREDTQIKDNLINQPLPKTISEYKNHPLYVLKRHLLKFEAIYPNSAVPLGYIRNEPVYARECVRQLHARETWMKEGRNVKVGEEPYKMVKSRPKWNKPKENPDIPDLPIFGLWQTEVYVPPPAVDGKIPRNEYGNVELYKPSMLPGGTVHLKEAGLNKVARKLGFDCAAAMIGWDFHGGSSHPVFDGWVVCIEHKEKILQAWKEDQERSQLREIEKRDKRIYGNWKKLIRGLLIRERLKKKYDLMEPEFMENEEKEENEEAEDAQSSWPRNLKKEKKTTERKKKRNLNSNSFT